MKRILPALVAVGALAIALPAAAQSWVPINSRQATLDARIDNGVRNGAISSSEAGRLRGEFRDIVNLEARYRATGGLQAWERTDLDNRLDRLSQKVRNERQEALRSGAWRNINARQSQLDDRIDIGLRRGSLTRSEAARLRAEFQELARLEARYRATGGLAAWERTDLDRRFDRLRAEIRVENADSQHGVGSNAGYHR